MNSIIPNPVLELITIKLLYMAVKSPYNGISTDKDYIYAMKRLLIQCEYAGVDFSTLKCEDNLIFTDILNLITEIKEHRFGELSKD